jgi:hypothetical protein
VTGEPASSITTSRIQAAATTPACGAAKIPPAFQIHKFQRVLILEIPKFKFFFGAAVPPGAGEMCNHTHVQGPKKFACQNEAHVPLLPTGKYTLVLPWVNLFVLTQPCLGGPAALSGNQHRPLSRAAGVPLRKPKDIFVQVFCPADFGGTNFSVPWTTRKADVRVPYETQLGNIHP